MTPTRATAVIALLVAVLASLAGLSHLTTTEEAQAASEPEPLEERIVWDGTLWEGQAMELSPPCALAEIHEGKTKVVLTLRCTYRKADSVEVGP